MRLPANRSICFMERGAQCFHPDKWKGLFPFWSSEGKRAYFVVPAKDCKGCEFHEAAKQYGRRKYARCRWYRENSGLESAAQLFVKSIDKAKQMMGIND